MWIVNPFVNNNIKGADFGDMAKMLMELHYDFNQISSFEGHTYYGVSLLAFSTEASFTPTLTTTNRHQETHSHTPHTPVHWNTGRQQTAACKTPRHPPLRDLPPPWRQSPTGQVALWASPSPSELSEKAGWFHSGRLSRLQHSTPQHKTHYGRLHTTTHQQHNIHFLRDMW